MVLPRGLQLSLLASSVLFGVSLLVAVVASAYVGPRIAAGYSLLVLAVACLSSFFSVTVTTMELVTRPEWRAPSSYALLALGAIPLGFAVLLVAFGLAADQ